MTRVRSGLPMIGIYDFSYWHYALGDALTWTMNVNVRAAEAGADAVDEYLVMDPRRPSSRYQPFINSHNYVTVIDNLFPAFLCSPKLRSLKLIRHAPTFNLFLMREALRRRPMWPGFVSHLNGKFVFSHHRRIDRYYARHGTLPWLAAPRGYSAWADAFRRERCAGRFVVAINVRQGALSLMPADLYRDSPLPEWEAFMAEVARRHPDALFLVLGGYTGWNRTLLRLPNVLVPRVLGLGLGHELAGVGPDATLEDVLGRPFASSSASQHPPEHAFDGRRRTYWRSDPAVPIRDSAFIGFDFGPDCALGVRQVIVRQWTQNVDGAGCVTRVAVQASDDGFTTDVRTADTLDLRPDASRQRFTVSPIGPARSWRALALSDAIGGQGWGLIELDLDSVPDERLESGRPIGSESAAMNVPPPAAFDGSPFTQWKAKERGEAVNGVSWIGYDVGPGREIEVRGFTIRQWDGGGRPNTISAVKVQYSCDGFVNDVRTADTVKIAPDAERHSYEIAPSAKARFWRLLADAPTDGGHWGVVELRLSQYPARRRPLRRTGARG